MGGTTPTAGYLRQVLDVDYAKAASEIEQALRSLTSRRLRRRGLVLGVSGGIDSSVCAMLAARAVGPRRVLGLLMPERSSSADSLTKGRAVCELAGVRHEVHEITSALEVLGCYRKQDEAIRRVFPQYVSGDRFKIAVADDVAGSDRISYFRLIVELSAEGGRRASARMPVDVYMAIVAATNLKQRVRKLIEYTRADELNYAVLGTPNRLEYDQGFFVRGGDGLADVKPIAHLYKSQVFALGRHLGLPPSITEQTPSTDTYSLPQTQEEFYFALPYPQMDSMLWAYAHKIGADEVGRAIGLTAPQVERVYRDIKSKRRMSRTLDAPAMLVRPHDWGDDDVDFEPEARI